MIKEQAYKVLQLSEDATKEDIKKKYENFMRLVKTDKSYDEKLYTEAFDLLMGYEFGEIKNEQDIYKKGLNKKKIENFFYHYKRHVIYGTLAIICFTLIFVSVLRKQPKPDVGVLFAGNAYVTDQLAIEDFFQQKFELEYVRVLSITMTLSIDGGVNEANMFKFAGIIQGAEADIIFTDIQTLNFLASDGALEDLSVHFNELGITKNDGRIIWLEDFDKGLIAAAIAITDFNGYENNIEGAQLKYISMPDYTKNTEKAIEVINKIANK